jgi:hypothetical protein
MYRVYNKHDEDERLGAALRSLWVNAKLTRELLAEHSEIDKGRRIPEPDTLRRWGKLIMEVLSDGFAGYLPLTELPILKQIAQHSLSCLYSRLSQVDMGSKQRLSYSAGRNRQTSY